MTLGQIPEKRYLILAVVVQWACKYVRLVRSSRNKFKEVIRHDKHSVKCRGCKGSKNYLYQ